MQRVVSCLLVALMATAPLQGVVAQELSEEQVERFKELTDLGNTKYEEGDYSAAAQAFIDAYQIRPISNILYNVGRIYEQAGRLENALEYFERFVKSPNVEQESRADALERIKTIKGVLELEEEETTDANAQTTPPPAAPAGEPDRTVSYIVLGSSAVLLGGSLAFGLLASGEYDTFENATTLQERRDAADSGSTFSIVSDSLLISGLIAAGVGTVLFFTAKPSEGGVAIAPYVGQHEAGLGLSLTY